MKNKNIFLKLFFLLNDYKLQFTSLLITMIIGLSLSLIQPLIWSRLIKVLFDRNIENLIKLLIGFGIFFIISQAINFIKGLLQNSLNIKLTCSLQQKIFFKINNVKFKYYEHHSPGELTEKITKDIHECINCLINQITPLFISIIQICLLLIIMIRMNSLLTIISITILPIIYFMSQKKSIEIQKKYLSFKEKNDFFMGFLQYSLKEFKNIKLFNLKNKQIKEFNNVTNDLGKTYYSLYKIELIFKLLISFCSVISEFLIFIVGSILVISYKVSVESFIAFTSYSQQLQQSFFSITNLIPQLSKMKVSSNRIFNLINSLEDNKELFGDKNCGDIKGDIILNNIYFNYNRENKLLENINVQFKNNSTNVIMGKNGVGKTTLINLLTKLYKPIKGSIYLDTLNINDLTEESLRKNIFVVNQENFLFNNSIKENLLNENSTLKEDDLDKICDELDIKNFIHSLPEKYNTIINQNSNNFSIGQRQKLLLAKSILSESKILILDEPTSALDNESKQKLIKLLNKIKQKRTLIIISHDKDLIKEMDYRFHIDNYNIFETNFVSDIS